MYKSLEVFCALVFLFPIPDLSCFFWHIAEIINLHPKNLCFMICTQSCFRIWLNQFHKPLVSIGTVWSTQEVLFHIPSIWENLVRFQALRLGLVNYVLMKHSLSSFSICLFVFWEYKIFVINCVRQKTGMRQLHGDDGAAQLMDNKVLGKPDMYWNIDTDNSTLDEPMNHGWYFLIIYSLNKVYTVLHALMYNNNNNNNTNDAKCIYHWSLMNRWILVYIFMLCTV